MQSAASLRTTRLHWRWIFFVLLLAGAGGVQAGLRPPAAPLVAHDPYFSIWSPSDKLADAKTIHWTGKAHALTCLARIDGTLFRLMGPDPAAAPALPQTALEVLPTRTLYKFGNENVRLTLTFLTPALPSDLDILSRPVTYIVFDVQSADGKVHQVDLYFDASAEIAVNEPGQAVQWGREETATVVAVKIGSKDQPVLAKRGDDLRIDWGCLYVAAAKSNGADAFLLPATLARSAFAGGMPLPAIKPAAPLAAKDAPVAGVRFAPVEAGVQSSTRWLMVGYDDGFSIKYFKQKLRPYWRRNGDDASALLNKAAAEFNNLKSRCEQYDAELMADLRRAGGDKYAELCALAYRQTFAGNKIAADDEGQPLMFPKENFSNGCIGTVDVLFPQAPFFLVFSPALTKAMLVPILDYAMSERWPYDYAPHDLGTYPHATGQVYGMDGKDGDRMPVEESGNMLIMLAALVSQEGNAGLVKRYEPMLAKWADYLVKEGLDPQNQLCSADMFGHLPRAVNLALKAIIGIGGYAKICEKTGRAEEAKKYLAIARDYAAKWQILSADEGRTRLAYHLPGTWGMKHNLIWDRVLGLNLFPASVGDAEIAWYLKVQKTYGLPVDNRTDTSLIDWALWSIAPARSMEDFQALLNPIWRYAQETPARVPLSDWFVTTDAKQKGFQARPVVGGIFIKLLSEPSLWEKWAAKGANCPGPWAPLVLPDPMKTVIPTSQQSAMTWHEETDMSPESVAALKPGKNVMAVCASQTDGGQCIDAGLVEESAPRAVNAAPVGASGIKMPGLRRLIDTPLRDTSLCRGPDGTWYLTGTVEPFWAYNEGIKLWRSRDLIHWTELGFVYRYGASPWHKLYLEKRKPLWAPEIHYIKGNFWLTYSLPGWDGTGKTSGCGLLKSTTGRAEGPYADVQPNERLGDEIDASLFQDDDGQVYFVWHSGKIARMKPDMSGLAEPYRWLKTSAPDSDPSHHSGLCPGIFGAGSFDHVGYEGMFLFKANGRYYLDCADSASGRYSCYIATSTNLFGPYSARYEAIPHGGHNMIFKDDQGQWWSSYFGSDDKAPWQERAGILPIVFDSEGKMSLTRP